MPVTEGQIYHGIKIGKRKTAATEALRASKDFFPVAGIQYNDPIIEVSLGSDSVSLDVDFPLFQTFGSGSDASAAGENSEGATALAAYLEKLAMEQAPDTVTLVSFQLAKAVGDNKASEFVKKYELELTNARIFKVRGSSNVYQVQADSGSLGTGEGATSKKPIDYITKKVGA